MVIIFIQWPLPDPEVIADLQAAECSEWREIAPERVYDAYPMTGDACFALRTLMVRERTVIASESDYDAWRVSSGIKRATKSLTTWALLMIGVYAVAWVTKALAGKIVMLRGKKPE